MKRSAAVIEGLSAFYAAYSSHDPKRFASALATGPGVSIIGTGPGEGQPDRDAWIQGYAASNPPLGLRLEGGPEPRGYADGRVGFVHDEPRFVLPDGRYVAARLTAVLHDESGRDEWKVVHLHFSVGVSDEDAFQRPASPEA